MGKSILLTFFVTLVLVISFSGCGNNDSKSNTPSTTEDKLTVKTVEIK
jgi:outer membrane lipoprotein SlyB